MPQNPTDPAIAMVATKTERLPRKETILQVLRDHIGDGVVPEDVEWQDGSLVFSLADASVAISMMPGPIPWSDLEGPCVTAYSWPAATMIMKAAKFHCLV